ncbi:MAG TPA: hypothetical protein VGR71_11720 [Nitrospira sp.]|nr:hypothetical protein [Nitrospira sp.]
MATVISITLRDDAEAEKFIAAMKCDRARLIYYEPGGSDYEELWPGLESIVSVEISDAVWRER